MPSPYVLQRIRLTNAAEFLQTVPKDLKERRKAQNNKSVLLAVLNCIGSCRFCSEPLGRLEALSGVSRSSLRNALNDLRALGYLSVIPRQGQPHLIAAGANLEVLSGLVLEE